MTSQIGATEYATFLTDAYLAGFVADGGAAVKFAVASDAAALDGFELALAEGSERLGFTFVRVDAAQTKVGMIQQVFFAVSEQIDWLGLARRVNASLASELYEDDGGSMTVAGIAEHNEVDQNIVRREMHKRLSRHVIKNYTLAKDFRVAMTQLCLAQLDDDALGQQSCVSILDWLRGNLRLISAVKPMQIYQRIGRHNARAMLVSTARWIRQTGGSGLVVNLDLRALAAERKRDVPEDQLYYTPAALWDTYEVLRQFIDATDEMEGLLVVVSAPDALLVDTSRRSLQHYRALKHRIWDDVRDRRQVNPYAPMVRIAEVQGGAV
ncbi:MAG: BREX system ATP-binding domain-containing protein [Thermoleophilia bacterium]